MCYCPIKHKGGCYELGKKCILFSVCFILGTNKLDAAPELSATFMNEQILTYNVNNTCSSDLKHMRTFFNINNCTFNIW